MGNDDFLSIKRTVRAYQYQKRQIKTCKLYPDTDATVSRILMNIPRCPSSNTVMESAMMIKKLKMINAEKKRDCGVFEFGLLNTLKLINPKRMRANK